MHSVFYLCSALDEETKHLRSITTDSPAATKKVFGLCKALQVSGVDVCILSLGRGRQNGSGAYFSRSDKEVEGIRVCYAAFWHKAILTHFVTAFSMACLLLRNSNQKNQSMLVYNRCWHYIPTLFVAKILCIRCFLDLEDGWVATKQSLPQTLLTLFFDWACNEGSLLACDSLAEQVKTNHVLTCYGVACHDLAAPSRKERGHYYLYKLLRCLGKNTHYHVMNYMSLWLDLAKWQTTWNVLL